MELEPLNLSQEVGLEPCMELEPLNLSQEVGLEPWNLSHAPMGAASLVHWVLGPGSCPLILGPCPLVLGPAFLSQCVLAGLATLLITHLNSDEVTNNIGCKPKKVVQKLT